MLIAAKAYAKYIQFYCLDMSLQIDSIVHRNKKDNNLIKTLLQVVDNWSVVISGGWSKKKMKVILFKLSYEHSTIDELLFSFLLLAPAGALIVMLC